MSYSRDRSRERVSRRADHEGKWQSFKRDHEREVADILRRDHLALQSLVPQLLERVYDVRNVRIAIEFLANNGGDSPGPTGVRTAQLSDFERWQLARCLSRAIESRTYRPGSERRQSIPKGSGRRRRKLVISDIEDRVVQRAALQILEPVLDPKFKRFSFGYRPRLDRLHALAYAEHFARCETRWFWVAADIADAFNSVPIPRLLEQLRSRLGRNGSKDLVCFLRELLQSRLTNGLRQGGSLSPLLLNFFLDQNLDVWWEKNQEATKLVRYADDLLVLCKTADQASSTLDALRARMISVGMPIKEATKYVFELKASQNLPWLGLQVGSDAGGFQYQPGDVDWKELSKRLTDLHKRPNAPLYAVQAIGNWVGSLGPAAESIDEVSFGRRLAKVMTDNGFDESFVLPEDISEWKATAFKRWEACRAEIRQQDWGSPSRTNHQNPHLESESVAEQDVV